MKATLGKEPSDDSDSSTEWQWKKMKGLFKLHKRLRPQWLVH